MNKSYKKQIIAHYTNNIQKHDAVLLIKNTNLPASFMVELRRSLERNNDKCFVVKNSLAKRAICTTSIDNLQQYLKGKIITIFSNEPVSTIKSLEQFDAQNLLIGGAIAGTTINKEKIAIISKFLLKDAIRHRISFSLKIVPIKILQTQKQVPLKIINIIKNRFTQK